MSYYYDFVWRFSASDSPRFFLLVRYRRTRPNTVITMGSRNSSPRGHGTTEDRRKKKKLRSIILSKGQCGFRPGKSTIDMMLLVRRLQ